MTVRPTVWATCCATIVSFCVVSFPARSRATTVIGTEPGAAENESVNAPSGAVATMCPFTVTTDPGSAVPATMTFCASRVAPATGAAMVIVGGVRSSTTVYDDAETTSRSPISVMLIEFAPSCSASVALKEPRSVPVPHLSTTPGRVRQKS